MAKLSQNEKLLMYLKTNGKIEPLEALSNLGIYRLSARIKELRERGHDIRTLMMDSKDGESRYARYIYVALEGESNNV